MPWVPTDVAGCVLWLKGDGNLYQDVAKTTPADEDGDVVKCWEDASGNGHDMTEGTNPPIIKLATLRGLPVVRFDGSNDELSNDFGAEDTHSIFLVTTFNTQTCAVNPGLVSCGAANNVFDFCTYLPNSKWITMSWDGANQYEVFSNAGAANGQSYLLMSDYQKGDHMKLWVDQVLQTDQSADGSVATFGKWYVGRRGDAAGFYKGDIAEVLIYDNIVSADNRDLIFDWLYDRWLAPVTNISKVAGVAYASIGKVSGVAIASISKIAGLA